MLFIPIKNKIIKYSIEFVHFFPAGWKNREIVLRGDFRDNLIFAQFGIERLKILQSCFIRVNPKWNIRYIFFFFWERCRKNARLIVITFYCNRREYNVNLSHKQSTSILATIVPTSQHNIQLWIDIHEKAHGGGYLSDKIYVYVSIHNPAHIESIQIVFIPLMKTSLQFIETEKYQVYRAALFRPYLIIFRDY